MASPSRRPRPRTSRRSIASRNVEVVALSDVRAKELADGIEMGRAVLTALGFEVWPTDANFLLVRGGANLADRLLREGMIVRPLDGFGMPEHARISIGLPEENERLVKTLRRLREGGT